MLTKKEKQRYLRHILLKEIGEVGQLKLKKARVLVIGAGGLGCPVLQYLTAAGVGKIGVIDDDVVDSSNLHRQILFSEKNIGEPKVITAKNRLQEMNSSIEIEAYNERLTAKNAVDLFFLYDIIVEGSDNFTTKYLANDAAVLAGKPLVFGSIFKFEGQVSVFNYRNGPTYRCLFPEPGSVEEMPSCSEVGVLGILPGIVGNLQANEVLKMVLGIGNVLSGKLLIFDSLEMQIRILPFSKNSGLRITRLKEITFSCETIPGDSISYQEYLESSSSFTLLDVRNPEERNSFNLGGLHIPLSELRNRSEELASEDNLVVYCASGLRSSRAISELKNKFSDKKIYNLEGGLKNVKN
ncbi:dinucleotide-utilizing protein [Salegentibacter salinarum]|uniref:Molybdopterin-synthase adenylyltransferase n=1 Tax=Salegentibacter salinarum TaxID=447422 RepID=A0A2N0U4N7_9FLAO|nr:HesA/MoeB/ThiF family protein [Salegentibacter salinarum]PKD21935.1 dinucleotide-utilizing protein [Salegentibacter salinarum]SKB35356.1 adenylyltransferase and sulfurtransferase [Salegentibacter salinarum]